MAAAPPPSSPGDLLAPGIPSPPPATPSAVLVDIRSDKKVPNEVPGDLIPQRLQHGGVGRVADSGLEGIEKQDSEEPMDGQADVDGDDLQSDMDGAGRKRKQCKNLPPPDRKRHKKTITKSDGPGDGQEDVNNDNTLIKSGAGSKKKRGKNLVVEQKQRNTPITKVVTSPGVNVLMSSTMLKRAMSLANSTRRARTAGSAEILPTQRAQVCPTLQDLSPSTRAANSHASTRRRRKLISSIWREAMPIYKDRRLVEGICNYCRQVFPASRDTGTSHILRHLKVCPQKLAMNAMVNQMGRQEGIAPNWKFDACIARRKLVKLVVVNELPFSLAEYPPFREFTAALNPWFENLSRTTLKNECMEAFKNHGNDLKEYFKNFVSRVSLTADMWTSNQKLGYLCITCHFISDNWKLNKIIIRFCMLETPHNSINMFNEVLETIQEWNLEDKLFGFTLDNASVNTAMLNFLRANLVGKGYLFSKGKLLHFRCATHVFNIVVQDGLRDIKALVNRIRDSVKYVKSTQARIEKFRELVIQVGLTSRYKPLSVDVTSRWNSTFLMLQAALPLRNVFHALKDQDKDYASSPLNDEWELAEAVCKLLRIFYTATTVLSGSNYPTSHLYFHQLWNIKKMLNVEELRLNRKILKNKDVTDQDTILAHMVKQMQTKFNIYWKETYMSACLPVVLDPRFKYDLLEFLLSDFETEGEAGTWMAAVKQTVQQLFSEYNKEVAVRKSDTQTPQVVEDEDDPLAEWDQYMRAKRKQSSSELDRYLKEDLHPRKEEIDILQWWQINTSKYTVLSKMARDILAVPASTVPSESAFSTGGRVVSDYRSSLSCSTVEALICLQDWLKGTDADHDE